MPVCFPTKPIDVSLLPMATTVPGASKRPHSLQPELGSNLRIQTPPNRPYKNLPFRALSPKPTQRSTTFRDRLARWYFVKPSPTDLLECFSIQWRTHFNQSESYHEFTT